MRMPPTRRQGLSRARSDRRGPWLGGSERGEVVRRRRRGLYGRGRQRTQRRRLVRILALGCAAAEFADPRDQPLFYARAQVPRLASGQDRLAGMHQRESARRGLEGPAVIGADIGAETRGRLGRGLDHLLAGRGLFAAAAGDPEEGGKSRKRLLVLAGADLLGR